MGNRDEQKRGITAATFRIFHHKTKIKEKLIPAFLFSSGIHRQDRR